MTRVGMDRDDLRRRDYRLFFRRMDRSLWGLGLQNVSDFVNKTSTLFSVHW